MNEDDLEELHVKPEPPEEELQVKPEVCECCGQTYSDSTRCDCKCPICGCYSPGGKHHFDCL